MHGLTDSISVSTHSCVVHLGDLCGVWWLLLLFALLLCCCCLCCYYWLVAAMRRRKRHEKQQTKSVVQLTKNLSKELAMTGNIVQLAKEFSEELVGSQATSSYVHVVVDDDSSTVPEPPGGDDDEDELALDRRVLSTASMTPEDEPVDRLDDPDNLNRI